MSALGDAAADYLALRRAVGFKLGGLDRPLADFVSYVEKEGDGTISVALALAWAAQGTKSAHRVARRLGWARCFCRYVQAHDPRHEVPPPRLLAGVGRARRIPHLYSESEILEMMHGARRLAPASWAATVEVVLGLLFVTGMRIGEVLALDLDDVDGDAGVLTVWLGKFDKSRLVPLAPSSLAALRGFLEVRNEMASEERSALFLRRDGRRRLSHKAFSTAFHLLLGDAGLPTGEERPRVHDLRHSFAVRTLVEWHRQGVEVQTRLALLSTYLGHVDPAATYWYLTGTPELLGIVAERLETDEGGRP